MCGPCLLWPIGWMDQEAIWYGGRSSPRQLCVRETQLPVPQRAESPQFLAHVCCGQTAGWIKMPFGREVGIGPGHIDIRWGLSSLIHKGVQPFPNFRPCLLWPNGRPSQLICCALVSGPFVYPKNFKRLCMGDKVPPCSVSNILDKVACIR